LTSTSTSSTQSPGHQVPPPNFTSSIDNSLKLDDNFNSPTLLLPTWLIPASYTSIGTFTPLDQELMHYYKANVWRGFVVRNDTAALTLHQDIIPQLGISHPFLLYALLSIAATQRNIECPSKEVERQALLYRENTFGMYKKALRNITAENYEAVLVAGSFLLALVPPPSSNPDKDGDADEEYMTWMFSMLKLSEGLRILASLRWSQGIEKMSVYPLVCRELLTLPPPPVLPSNLDAPIGPLGTTPVNPNPAPTYLFQHPTQTRLFLPPPLKELLDNILTPKACGPIDLHRATLVPAFHALSPIFLSLYYYHLNPDFYVRIMVMTSFLMPDFLLLVQTSEPRALVIVGWWFALAAMIPQRWWVGSKVGSVVRAIGREIEKQGDGGLVKRVFRGAKKIVDIFEREGRESAARSVFEGWCGVRWEEGPLRAKEWEVGVSLDLGNADVDLDVDVNVDVTGFDFLKPGFLV
jgi:hypothetical protein